MKTRAMASKQKRKKAESIDIDTNTDTNTDTTATATAPPPRPPTPRREAAHGGKVERAPLDGDRWRFTFPVPVRVRVQLPPHSVCVECALRSMASDGSEVDLDIVTAAPHATRTVSTWKEAEEVAAHAAGLLFVAGAGPRVWQARCVDATKGGQWLSINACFSGSEWAEAHLQRVLRDAVPFGLGGGGGGGGAGSPLVSTGHAGSVPATVGTRASSNAREDASDKRETQRRTPRAARTITPSPATPSAPPVVARMRARPKDPHPPKATTAIALPKGSHKALSPWPSPVVTPHATPIEMYAESAFAFHTKRKRVPQGITAEEAWELLPEKGKRSDDRFSKDFWVAKFARERGIEKHQVAWKRAHVTVERQLPYVDYAAFDGPNGEMAKELREIEERLAKAPRVDPATIAPQRWTREIIARWCAHKSMGGEGSDPPALRAIEARRCGGGWGIERREYRCVWSDPTAPKPVCTWQSASELGDVPAYSAAQEAFDRDVDARALLLAREMLDSDGIPPKMREARSRDGSPSTHRFTVSVRPPSPTWDARGASAADRGGESTRFERRLERVVRAETSHDDEGSLSEDSMWAWESRDEIAAAAEEERRAREREEGVVATPTAEAHRIAAMAREEAKGGLWVEGPPARRKQVLGALGESTLAYLEEVGVAVPREWRREVSEAGGGGGAVGASGPAKKQRRGGFPTLCTLAAIRRVEEEAEKAVVPRMVAQARLGWWIRHRFVPLGLHRAGGEDCAVGGCRDAMVLDAETLSAD
jgi:hypothetical protein